jgi:hypothetical protein
MYPGKLAATKKNVAPEAAGDAESDTADSENADEPRLDPLRDEALNILADLAGLTQGPKTASATTAPPTP